MRIAFRGNHQQDVLNAGGVPWSTETHLSGSLELLGHEVIRNNEQSDDWATTVAQADGCDLFMWTSTWGYAEQWPKQEAFAAVAELNERMPTACVHLDLWWGLNREWQLRENAMFQCRWLFTADGDHDDLWQRSGLGRHHWFPPAVFGPECIDGTPVEEWRSDVAFVGSWQQYAHPEHWPHRKALLDRLSDVYGERVTFWPRPGRGAVRSQNLNNLLASVKVVVGDSCNALTATRYHSDRVWECVGRGGFIVHPAVPGLVDMLPDGCGVAYFPPGDLDAMVETVERWTADDAGREVARKEGQSFVAEHHTYTNRLRQVLETMDAEGAWS